MGIGITNGEIGGPSIGANGGVPPGTYAPLPTGSPAVGDAVVVTQDSPLILGYEAILSFTGPLQIAVGTGVGTGEIIQAPNTTGATLNVGGSDPSGFQFTVPSAPPSVAVLPNQQPNSGSGDILPLPYIATGYAGNGYLAPTNGVAYYYPLILNDTAEVVALTARCSSGGSTGALLRMGIYNDSGGKPGTVVVDGGTVAATGSGYPAVTLTQTLTAGRYWVVIVVQGAPATTPQLQTITSQNVLSTGFSSTLTNAFSPQNGGSVGFSQTGVTGALATASSLSYLVIGSATNFPIVAVTFN